MSRRGTDPATERRQVRPREEETDELGKWLNGTFDAAVEVLGFGLPALIGVWATGNVELWFVAVAALGGLVAATSYARRRSDLPWPSLSPALAGLRLLFYNLAFAGSVVLAAAIPAPVVLDAVWVDEPALVPAAVALGLTVLAGLGFPRLAYAVDRLA
jgi:hypothetical protein